MGFPCAKVWFDDREPIIVSSYEEWQALPNEGVVFVAQKLPQGGHFPGPGDYYWTGVDGEIQAYTGGGPALQRMFNRRGIEGALDDIPDVKAGVTVLRDEFNTLVLEGMAWAREDCEGCGG